MTCLRLLKSLSLTLSYRPASCSSHFHFSFRLNKINNWVQRKGEALALWLSRFGGNSESLCKIPDGAVQGESEIFSADIILFCSCRSFAGHHGNLCTSYCTLFFFPLCYSSAVQFPFLLNQLEHFIVKSHLANRCNIFSDWNLRISHGFVSLFFFQTKRCIQPCPVLLPVSELSHAQCHTTGGATETQHRQAMFHHIISAVFGHHARLAELLSFSSRPPVC
jgi:hypothetical protein